MMKLLWSLFFVVSVSLASANGRKERKRGRGRGEGYRVMDGHRGGMRGRGGGKGRGKGRGRWGWGWGQGRGQGDDVCMQKGEMMGLIHDLMDNSGPDGNIEREYSNTTEGIESYTYSTDREVGSWIQTHVDQMTRLMDSESCGIRMWDPLFNAMFDLRDFHKMVKLDKTEDEDGKFGVKVAQEATGDDKGARKCATDLIQAHANVVSRFVEFGWDEMDEYHPVPDGDCEDI